MTTKASDKIVQYLNEARATEHALVSTLRAHIAMAPDGAYRRDLERHLRETRSHADRIDRRLEALGAQRGLVDQGVGVLQSLLGQALALSKGPLDAIRGEGLEEKLLKNAKDECATEALEIATYRALEALARSVGDDRTAELAASIREDEEAMLERLLEYLPGLVVEVVREELDGVQNDLPIAGYDDLTVEQVRQRLEGLSPAERERVVAYERSHKARAGVLSEVA